jgi:hypothetical protein
VQFDLRGNGTAQQVGWVAANDGLLVRDVNHDGVINDGKELFGSGTVLANGSTAENGYEALAQLDSNLDGTIDAKDTEYAELGVWVDSNSDGVTQAGEIHTLSALGITQLNANANMTLESNNGNMIFMESSYTSADGETHEMADVWFRTQSGTIDIAKLSTADIAALSTAQVAAFTTADIAALSTAQVAALSNEGVAALSTAQLAALTTADIAAMSSDQIAALSANDLAAMSKEQVAALTADDIAALHQLGKDSVFSDMQIHVMNESQARVLQQQGLDAALEQQGYIAHDLTSAAAAVDPAMTGHHDAHVAAQMVDAGTAHTAQSVDAAPATPDAAQVDIPHLVQHNLKDILLLG